MRPPDLSEPRISVIGWQAFHKGDYAEAVDTLSRAIDNYFQSPDTHRIQITENITHILQFSDRLNFSAPRMYQWAKNLSEMDLFSLAITCFDKAACDASNPHIQKNSLLNAAMNRIRAGEDLKRARADLKKVIQLDSNGIHAQQAEQILGYMDKKDSGS